MTNPITRWIQRNMQSQEDRDRDFENLVAYESINSIKIIDSFNVPMYTKESYKYEPRTQTKFNRHLFAHSTFRSTTGGFSSSASAAEFYCDLAKMKREDILAKYRAEMM